MARPREEEGPSWPPFGDLRVLNRDIPRVDGPDKVQGSARYTHDVRLPGMVYARLLLCPHPVATAKIDTAPALAVPGVVDAIVLTEDETRFLGQPVAAVAAETPEQAEDGVRALGVEFTEGEWVVTPEQALEDGAPSVRKDGNVGRESERGELAVAEAALVDCAAVVEATYTLPVQHHVCLETHGVVVDYRGGDEATIYASTQGTITIAGDCAEELGLDESQVVCIVDHMGGGFGSKFGPGMEGMTACKLAKRLGRPVHLMLTRQAEFLAAGNRSGGKQTVRAGIDGKGLIRGLIADIDRYGGVRHGSNPGLPYGPYQAKVQKSLRKMRSVYTHMDGNRAMRAPGHPQASFAMESIVDELAYAAGLDPLEVRKTNLEDEVWHRQLDRVAAEVGWDSHAHKTRPGGPDDWTKAGIATGIGFGVSVWGGGGRAHDRVEVQLHSDGSVTASVASQDIGVGVKTYLAAIVAEELGLDVADVTPRVGDSRFGPGQPSGGSVTTAHLAPAAKDAAHKARLGVFDAVAKLLDAEPDELAMGRREIHVKDEPGRKVDWKTACLALGYQGLTVSGTWQKGLSSNGVHGAQAAKVEVDTLTGKVRVTKMVCMQDQGLPLNRLALRSQINGGMIQALSYGLFEERVLDPWLGVSLSANLEEYKIAGCQEIPELVAIIDDEDERGVIGMAEATIIPGHGAIANAVYNACGVRIRDLPLTPDKVLMGLVAQGGGR